MYLLAFVVFFALSIPSAHGQTVSILNGGEDPAAKAVEAALSHTLQAKGYLVKANSTDGFVLLLTVLKVQTSVGASAGLAGSLTIVSKQGQQVAEFAPSKPCQAEQAMAQRFRDDLGTRLSWIAGTIAFAPTTEALADLLSGFSHKTVQAAAHRVDVLAREAQKLNTQAVRP